MNKKAVLEGILFLSGSEGINIEDLSFILECEEEEIKSLICSLGNDYESSERGIKLEILGEQLKLTTKKEHKEYYEKLVEVEQNGELSTASLETLAIIAYNQPVTRVKIDEIRGVGCSHIVRKLVNMGLIEDCGRTDAPGRPMLYQTTKQFLDHFGLAKIEDLPKLSMPEENTEIETLETDLFESKYKEQ